jgi:hypothetical protein
MTDQEANKLAKTAQEVYYIAGKMNMLEILRETAYYQMEATKTLNEKFVNLDQQIVNNFVDALERKHQEVLELKAEIKKLRATIRSHTVRKYKPIKQSKMES